MDFKTIEWKDDKVFMIDQRKLPLEETYVECSDYKQVADAIRSMVIRGAPAIGVAAAMGVALGALGIDTKSYETFAEKINTICEKLRETRPTAVNLSWALTRMKEKIAANRSLSIEEIKSRLREEAIRIACEDIAINRAMGKEGATLIESGQTLLTHCNAGALATAGYGTALGVFYAAQEEGKIFEVLVDETRPFLQGARLTAWELNRHGIPLTLITDNMAGTLMREQKVNAVFVGADRIAANGDVANKVGTYSVAILARYHEIPFYVVAPLSTIDLNTPTGKQIPIEERSTEEVTNFYRQRVAPDGIKVRNPAFDVTPHELVTAIVTEKGIVRGSYQENLRMICKK